MGVNYQMQIVTTKLPNENNQTYQLQMIDSGGRGKLPIVIPSTTTLFHMSSLKMRNIGNIQTYQLQMIDSMGGGGKLPIIIPSTTNTISHVKLKNEVTICIWQSPPPQNRSFVVGRFGYFHLVVWQSQFAFGSLPPPPPTESIICSFKYLEIESGRPFFTACRKTFSRFNFLQSMFDRKVKSYKSYILQSFEHHESRCLWRCFPIWPIFLNLSILWCGRNVIQCVKNPSPYKTLSTFVSHIVQYNIHLCKEINVSN